ncbi:MAG: DUF4279 domain-containing protein [Limnohabitans sp.]|nr:DUF4279 domain-containing protein [Limnohabitans sp.]
MEKTGTYVYFALKGENFDFNLITDRLGIQPTEVSNVGEQGRYTSSLSFGSWILSTERGKEDIFIDNLINEIVDKLFGKIDIINELKKKFQLESVLEIVMYVDVNEEVSTPALNYNLKAIEFLFKTQTVVDVDIYRFF